MSRPPSAASVLKNMKKQKFEPKTPIASDMFLPNQSGDHSAGIVNTTPTADNDIANKKYVDTQDGLYLPLTGGTLTGITYFDGTPTGLDVLYSATIGNHLTVGNNIYQDDNDKHIFGTGNDAEIYYNGTNLIIDPDVVGTGRVNIGADAKSGLTAGEIISQDRSHMRMRTGNTVYNSLMFGAGGADMALTVHMAYDQGTITVPANAGRQFVIGQHDFRDYDHPVQTNPTLFVQSATDPNTANDEWISMTHDQTDGIIAVGSGKLLIGATGDDDLQAANIEIEGSVTPSLKITTTGATSDPYTLIGWNADQTIAGKIWYDVSTGDLYVDNLQDADTGDIYIRTRASGTPINALTISGTGNIGILNTTATAGQITIGGDRFLHAYENAANNYNVFVGRLSGNLTLTGIYNTGVGGRHALVGLTSGGRNTAIGYRAGGSITSGSYNTMVGQSTGAGTTTGSFNTFLGVQNGLNLGAGDSRNIFLGAYAGFYSTGSNELFIDNQTRTNEATQKVSSIIYGVMDAVAADQILTFNAGKVNVLGAINSGTATITASSDTTNVSGINTLFINITGDIVLGGLTGGVNGQTLNIVMIGNFVNHCTIEHAEGIGGSQDFINHTATDEDISHGGSIYVCNGTNWYDTSHAKHV